MESPDHDAGRAWQVPASRRHACAQEPPGVVLRAMAQVRRFIPLGGAFKRFLAAPLDLFEAAARHGAMVRYPKYTLNERGHACWVHTSPRNPKLFRPWAKQGGQAC